jgi:hypothetical protein
LRRLLETVGLKRRPRGRLQTKSARRTRRLAGQFNPLNCVILWTEEMRSAPPDGISVSIKCDWPACPVAAGASDGRRNHITRVCHVAGLHHISRTVSTGDGTAQDSAGNYSSSDANSNSTAPTARFSRRRRQQGNCHRCGSGKCEKGLVHCGRLLHISVEPTIPR